MLAERYGYSDPYVMDDVTLLDMSNRQISKYNFSYSNVDFYDNLGSRRTLARLPI